jgi:hypothetical protein
MNAIGKLARSQTGMNRHQTHFARHTRKSDEARKRHGWTKGGTLKRVDGKLIQPA